MIKLKNISKNRKWNKKRKEKWATNKKKYN